MPRQGAFCARAAALAAVAVAVDREEEDGWGPSEVLETEGLAVASIGEAPRDEEPNTDGEVKAPQAPCRWAAANEPQMGKDIGQKYYEALVERRRVREALLKEEEESKLNEYVADNGQLQAKAPGITYRLSKRMEDRDEASPLARWGTVVLGADERDGWLKVGERYLPFEVQGMRVLTLRSRFSSPIVEESGDQNVAETEERARKREHALRRQMTRARKRALTHYGLLGLPRSATTEDITQAFRALAKLYHPDKVTAPGRGEAPPWDSKGREAREQHMRALNEAHQVLADPLRRRAYDRDLDPSQLEMAASLEDQLSEIHPRRERRQEPKVEDYDFDFSGFGRPFRFARGRASRVCAECGSSRKEQIRLAMRQLRGKEKMELSEQRGIVRHVGPRSPFSRLGECGLPDCFANRVARPEVRAQFRDFIIGRLRDAKVNGAGWWDNRGLRYTSLGSGELLFDLELLERIRHLGIRIDQVCLVDQEYRAPRMGAKGALRQFADWQRVSAEMAKVEPAEILAFGWLSDYYEATKSGGRAVGCHLLVHCDAHWNGAFEDCERLAQSALVRGGLLARLATGDGDWRSPDGEVVGAPSDARRLGSLKGVFCGDPPDPERGGEEADDDRPAPIDVHGNGGCTMAAWIVEPMPPETFRPPALLPVDDPRLNTPTKSVARRRAEEQGLPVWKVVHNPRVAVRGRPDTQGKVEDVFYTGDELVMTGERRGPWLRLSEMTWADVADAPAEAWVLSDGSSIGLGKLLEQAYDPAAAQVRRDAVADDDSEEDSDGSDDAELLEQLDEEGA